MEKINFIDDKDKSNYKSQYNNEIKGACARTNWDKGACPFIPIP